MPLGSLFSSKSRTCLIAVSIATKAVVMTLTPMSLELAFLMSQVTYPSKWDLTPYGKMMEYIFKLWQAIPVDHPVLATSWTVEVFKASTGLYLLVFMEKFPLLILDFVTGLLLYQILLREGLSEKKASIGFFLWFLNPYVIVVNQMWAAIDLIPTLLLLLSIFFVQARKPLRGAVAFGAAIAAKLFPVLLLPIFASIGKRSKFTLAFVTSTVLGVGAYFAWVAYAGFNPGFQLQQYDPFMQYFEDYAVVTSNGAHIGLATVALIVVYAFVAEKWPRTSERLYEPVLMAFLVWFALSNWFPQFLMWMIPLLIIDGIVSEKKHWVFTVILLSTALFLDVFALYPYFTANGHAFFFIPADTAALRQAVAAFESLANDIIIVGLAEPIARDLFTFTCLIYMLKIAAERTGLNSALSSLLRRRT
ncbi:MAG: hypothetical protein ABSC50_09985 [Candidatus Bathyarchaeia archaeon]